MGKGEMTKGILVMESVPHYSEEGLARLKRIGVEPMKDGSWLFLLSKWEVAACHRKVMWAELGEHAERVFDFLQRVAARKYEVFENNYAIPAKGMAQLVVDTIRSLGVPEGAYSVVCY